VTTVFVSHPSHRLEHYFGARALGALRGIAEVRLNPHPRDLHLSELLDGARGCDALIAYRQTEAPRALFEGLAELSAFMRCAVDIRNVDVDAASDHGVLVTHTSAGYVTAVCEWVLAAMVDLARGISRHAAQYRAGEVPAPTMGQQLRGATLGIIGYGQIGSALGELALALGMKLVVCTPQSISPRPALRQAALETLLGESDFVVCLAPANAETDRMMDAGAFSQMRREAFFINASRGELVDDEALLAALDRGHLSGCALDVGRAPDQMPSPALARHPRVVATPHIGGLTPEAVEHQAMETVEQLRKLLGGTIPAGAVNADHATRLARLRARAADAH